MLRADPQVRGLSEKSGSIHRAPGSWPKWLWMRIDECDPKYLWGLLERQLATCLVAIWVSLCELCEPVTGLCVAMEPTGTPAVAPLLPGCPVCWGFGGQGKGLQGVCTQHSGVILTQSWEIFGLWIKMHRLFRRNSLLVIVGFSWKHTGAS